MAIWHPDLTGRRGPRYLQIVEALAEDIASGLLPAETRLPPHRELAWRLGLSPNTTSRAYAEAVRRALLRGEVGRGSYVRGRGTLPRDGAAGDLRRETGGPVDLARNLPLAELPVRRTLAAIAREGGIAALLDFQSEADLARHTAAAALWLRLCGLEAAPEEITVTSGAQHGLFCALMALMRPGDLLLVEALSYPPLRAMADRLGLRLQAVAMDAAGIDPSALEAACRGAQARALYLVPTLQTATTATLAPARRQEIAALARHHDLMLIEDDVFGLLKPDRPAPLATLAPERTVYATSVSKCLAPGLRVGYLRAPLHLGPALRQAVNLSQWMTPPLTAEIAARLVLDGSAGAMIAAQRRAAAHRQRIARAVLGGRDFIADPQGLHLWLPLPAGWRADLFRAEAERRGVLVAEAQSFALNPADGPEAVRLSLSQEPVEARLQAGLAVIAGLLDQPPVRARMMV